MTISSTRNKTSVAEGHTQHRYVTKALKYFLKLNITVRPSCDTYSRDIGLTNSRENTARRRRWGEMRSEKDQMAVDKEKSVEIQFRDIPREQENTVGNLKQKEEKKEVFSKVGKVAFWHAPHCLRLVKKTDMEEVAETGIISAPRTAKRPKTKGFCGI